MEKSLTLAEAKVIGLMFSIMASREGEDIIGVLMKCGMFHYLPSDQALVDLAMKLENYSQL
jgi:hypothetical protein